MKSIKETSEIFNVSPATVRRWIYSGKLKVVKINKRLIRIEDAEIEKLKKGE